ncbi:MAG: hypothetical protein R3E12_06405 [Candidatus Eisenbacteria bacterium]
MRFGSDDAGRHLGTGVYRRLERILDLVGNVPGNGPEETFVRAS